MRVYWIHPERDEAFVFDLPDGSKQVQVGSPCPEHAERSIVSANIADREFCCVDGPGNRGERHQVWPRLAHRFEYDGDSVVAEVFEGSAPPFTVRPSGRGTTQIAFNTESP